MSSYSGRGVNELACTINTPVTMGNDHPAENQPFFPVLSPLLLLFGAHALARFPA